MHCSSRSASRRERPLSIDERTLSSIIDVPFLVCILSVHSQGKPYFFIYTPTHRSLTFPFLLLTTPPNLTCIYYLPASTSAPLNTAFHPLFLQTPQTPTNSHPLSTKAIMVMGKSKHSRKSPKTRDRRPLSSRPTDISIRPDSYIGTGMKRSNCSDEEYIIDSPTSRK